MSAGLFRKRESDPTDQQSVSLPYQHPERAHRQKFRLGQARWALAEWPAEIRSFASLGIASIDCFACEESLIARRTRIFPCMQTTEQVHSSGT
jgi:hypothetical protein